MKDDSVPRIERSENSVSSTVLERAKQGDQQAFQCISKLYSGLVYHWCRRAGLQPPDAEDVGQQVFIAVSKNLTKFKREAARDSFRAWLRVITRSKVVDHSRAMADKEKGMGGEQWAHVAAKSLQDVESEEDIRHDTNLLYQRAIQFIQGEFSERDCEAFSLVVFYKFTAKEAAEKLGTTPNAIYIAKSRILKRLKDEFAGLLDEPS